MYYLVYSTQQPKEVAFTADQRTDKTGKWQSWEIQGFWLWSLPQQHYGAEVLIGA